MNFDVILCVPVKVNTTELENNTVEKPIPKSDPEELSLDIDNAVNKFFDNHILRFKALGKDIAVSHTGKCTHTYVKNNYLIGYNILDLPQVTSKWYSYEGNTISVIIIWINSGITVDEFVGRKKRKGGGGGGGGGHDDGKKKMMMMAMMCMKMKMMMVSVKIILDSLGELFYIK